MAPLRKAVDVLQELLHAMSERVTVYHPTVGRTGITVDSLIQGTAFFPGGAGLWRGRASRGTLPEFFPEVSLMLVAHNFDSVRGHELALQRGGEAEGSFWNGLLRVLSAGELAPEMCFFTNALMGLKPGSAIGKMPRAPGYVEQCCSFLRYQVDLVRPRAVVALGLDAGRILSQAKIKHLALKHPSSRMFRALAGRDELLSMEGHKLRHFLDSGIKHEGLASRDIKMLVAGRTMEHNRVKKVDPNTLLGGATDDWGFRLGTASSFLMGAIALGGRTKADIREEFDQAFPRSVGKSTFNVFFSDVARPFGSASASRCFPMPKGEQRAIHVDADRAQRIKRAIARGMLKEINRLEPKGSFPKLNRPAVDDIVRRFEAPLD